MIPEHIVKVTRELGHSLNQAVYADGRPLFDDLQKRAISLVLANHLTVFFADLDENDLSSLVRDLLRHHDQNGCGTTLAGGFCLHYRSGLLSFLAHGMMVSPDQLAGEVRRELEEYIENCPHCQDPRLNEGARR
jgi:hypothetical protein